MRSKIIWVAYLLCVQFVAPPFAQATTIFAGSFVDLNVDAPSKSVSINYPRLGAKGICGVEFKSNVIVLNMAVWERLAQLIEVREVADGRDLDVISPKIESAYSPTLRYVLSDYESEYSALQVISKSGIPMKDVVNQVLGTKSKSAQLIAVAYTCPPHSNVFDQK